ncbi:hypothetical protein BN1200_220011 [Klebsiella variicola]|nr:hypothetical protein BN1200_220011 [Klebsiella variicola]
MIALVEYLVQARSSFERIALAYQLLGALVVTGSYHYMKWSGPVPSLKTEPCTLGPRT